MDSSNWPFLALRHGDVIGVIEPETQLRSIAAAFLFMRVIKNRPLVPCESFFQIAQEWHIQRLQAAAEAELLSNYPTSCLNQGINVV